MPCCPTIQEYLEGENAYVMMVCTEQYKSVWGWKTQHGHLLALFAPQLFSPSPVLDISTSVLNTCYQGSKLL